MPFGGFLGSTFNFVFETQLENLQNGDRFYYLARLAGLNFLNELENNSFAKLIMANTDTTHLPGDVFSTPGFILEVDQTKQFTDITVPLAVDNASFEALALTTGTPGVITDALGNFTLGSPTDWTITGVGGLYAPTAAISDPAGHEGANVVWLREGATLSQDTGEVLVQGNTYTFNFSVGDRTDLAFPGGTARLIATNGTTTIELATIALPTPVEGGWAPVSLSSGPIAATAAGFQLRVEVTQNASGGANQILIDDIEITRNDPSGDPTGGVVINGGVAPLPVDNASFEALALTTGTPGVFTDALGNFTVEAPTDWTITGGVGGLYAPAAAINDPAGHDGANVVWLREGATLAQDTGEILLQGNTYTFNFSVGDRTDQAFPGGTARLIATNGTTTIELATIALPTPAVNGGWAPVSLSSGPIAAAVAGFQLRVEVTQDASGGANQILIDNIEITSSGNGVELIPLVIRNNPGTLGPDPNYLQYTGDQHVVLGGTDLADILISSEGDDTLYGDGGNDRLEGGYGNDLIMGGAGDDIMTDIGGDDNLQGDDGNDVIHGGQGENLILGGRGSDFIITGEDITEVFAGMGNDFIFGAKTNLINAGNEGDDWIELGTQDGAPGDNFDPQQQDPVIGNDVLIGGGGIR